MHNGIRMRTRPRNWLWPSGYCSHGRGVKGENFTAPSGFEAEIEKGGQKTKYRKNVAAISLLKVLEAENRVATL